MFKLTASMFMGQPMSAWTTELFMSETAAKATAMKLDLKDIALPYWLMINGVVKIDRIGSFVFSRVKFAWDGGGTMICGGGDHGRRPDCACPVNARGLTASTFLGRFGSLPIFESSLKR